MAMFPVFTVYVTSLYTPRDRRGTTLADDATNKKQEKR
jgi:hypothetical protein